MIDIAINYKEQLNTKMKEIWFKEEYKFYSPGPYYYSFECEDNTLNMHQFVSIDSNGKVVGYIGYNINRDTHSITAFATINFGDNKILFANDLKSILYDIFEKFKFNKINFSVVIGNPVEKFYDKIISKFNGRIVGIFEQDVRLFDNKLYDVKYYELKRESYLERKICSS